MEVVVGTALKRKIYTLLLIGSAIVAASFSVVFIFGQGTWKSWWLANVLHFIGGGYAVFFVRTLFQYAKLQYRIILPWWMELWMYVGGALILGVFWEWYELGMDRYVLFVLKGQSKMSYADNIGDLIIDFMGAVAAALFILPPEDHGRKPVNEWSRNPKGKEEYHGRKPMVGGFISKENKSRKVRKAAEAQ